MLNETKLEVTEIPNAELKDSDLDAISGGYLETLADVDISGVKASGREREEVVITLGDIVAGRKVSTLLGRIPSVA